MFRLRTSIAPEKLGGITPTTLGVKLIVCLHMGQSLNSYGRWLARCLNKCELHRHVCDR